MEKLAYYSPMISRIATSVLPDPDKLPTTPGNFDIQSFAAGVQFVATGVIGVAKGLELIDRACPGLCQPDRDPQLLR